MECSPKSSSSSLERTLQSLSVVTWLTLFVFGGLVSIILTVYLTIFTSLRWFVLFYAIWIYFDDIEARGGRPLQLVKRWILWTYFKNYYPLKLVKTPGWELDPGKNYLCGCFPHGMLPTGVFYGFGTPGISEFSRLFPKHEARVVTLAIHFKIPFFREIVLALGAVSASRQSISYILGKEGGGEMLALMPGGAAEAYNCHPGSYKILVGKRKGFVRLALQNGAPLVPVISFGENDVYDQVTGPYLHTVQEFVRKIIGIAPIIPLGTGIFQNYIGLLPQRCPITTVVGKPMEVERIKNPTKEDIDRVHAEFIKELVNLFESQKHLYLENAEEKHMEI